MGQIGFLSVASISSAKEIAKEFVHELLNSGTKTMILLIDSLLNGGSNWARTSDLIDVNDAL